MLFETLGSGSKFHNFQPKPQMLFEAPGAGNYLCAAILDPETLYQKSSSAGSPLFPDRLKALGIIPGVKPHLKVYNLPGQSGSTSMQVRCLLSPAFLR